MRYALVSTVSLLILVGLAFDAIAEEYAVRVGEGAAFWVHADRRSTTAEPGKDGRGRLHIKVKNGDLVSFEGNSNVVFEDGAEEKGKVWEYVKTPGPEIHFVPLDEDRKKFYVNPDKALMTMFEEPFVRRIVIEIKNVTANQPILFASAEFTQINPQGLKNLMFGAIVLDIDGESSKKK